MKANKVTEWVKETHSYLGTKSKTSKPAVRPIMVFERKTGGILPLIFSALGSLAGVFGAIAKAIIDAKTAKKKLEEDKRHNAVMEEKRFRIIFEKIT